MGNRTSLTLLLLLVATAAPAQWDDAEILTHPRVPETRPFVLEVHGTWGNACNPSAAEPVITHFDGESLEIDFVVDQCPPTLSVPYQYRVLVDISPAFEGDESYDTRLDVTLRFGDNVLEETILLRCFLCDPPPPAQRVFPEPGLYQAFGHEKQGLLLARQDERLAVYPLVYDEEGASEWLFAGGGIDGNAYFAPLYQASGGQCLGCPPPIEPPNLEPIGAVTMVFDSQGIVQMQIDDGPFVEYRQSDFGRAIRGANLPDLAGVWAILESEPATPPEGTASLASVLPYVFELRYVEPDPDVIYLLPPHVLFNARDLDNQLVADFLCESNAPFNCQISVPNNGNAEFLFNTTLQSLDRMSVTTYAPLPDGVEPPTAVIVRAEP